MRKSIIHMGTYTTETDLDLCLLVPIGTAALDRLNVCMCDHVQDACYSNVDRGIVSCDCRGN